LAWNDGGNNQEKKMQIKFHHINLCTGDVPGLDGFYRDILDMKSEPGLAGNRDKDQGYSGNVSFLTDGSAEATQFHLAEKDLKIGFKTGQAVNPLEKGHLAFRTDDIAAFKKRLEAKGIPYSDFGTWAMKGWEQIFFYDPSGNIIEVHQVHE
jgi:catechol 2,3-dioxygenase-like lactoylglutathione lyase family enzyme